MSDITRNLHHAMEVAEARYKAAGVTLPNQADETREVLSAVTWAIFELDKRLDRLEAANRISD